MAILTRAVDRIRSSAQWEVIRSSAPTAARIASSAFYASRALGYARIYSQFQAFTMIPRSDYISNLSLCDRFRFVKGSVIECGTWKGGMIAGIATVLGPTRAYYLYDSFQGLPAANEEDAVDGSSGREWEGRLATTKEFAEEAMRLSGASDYRIIPGWFKDTLPTYAGGPIAILRIDGDFYDSVLDTLNNLYDKVVNGGIVIIDDYYCWHGARRAVHDFLSANRLLDTLWQHRGGEYVYMLKHRGREVESKC